MTDELFVGGLSEKVTRQELQNIFGRYGELRDVHLKDKGFAFLQFRELCPADEIIKNEHGKVLHGRAISVERRKPNSRCVPRFRFTSHTCRRPIKPDHYQQSGKIQVSPFFVIGDFS